MDADTLPESDCNKTRRLWSAVEEARITTISSRGHRGGRATGQRGARPKAAKACRVSPERDTLQTAGYGVLSEEMSIPESATEELDDASSVRSRKLPPPGSQFRALVLAPRRIAIDEKRTIIPSACAHFGTSRPTVPYKQLPELEAASVWLQIDQTERTRIAKHYIFMQYKRLCEDEFAT